MKQFIFNIIICSLFEVFTGVLLPDGAMKKSLLSVISIYLLYVLIVPFLSVLKGWLPI